MSFCFSSSRNITNSVPISSSSKIVWDFSWQLMIKTELLTSIWRATKSRRKIFHVDREFSVSLLKTWASRKQNELWTKAKWIRDGRCTIETLSSFVRCSRRESSIDAESLRSSFLEANVCRCFPDRSSPDGSSNLRAIQLNKKKKKIFVRLSNEANFSLFYRNDFSLGEKSAEAKSNKDLERKKTLTEIWAPAKQFEQVVRRVE